MHQTNGTLRASELGRGCSDPGVHQQRRVAERGRRRGRRRGREREREREREDRQDTTGGSAAVQTSSHGDLKSHKWAMSVSAAPRLVVEERRHHPLEERGVVEVDQ